MRTKTPENAIRSPITGEEIRDEMPQIKEGAHSRRTHIVGCTLLAVTVGLGAGLMIASNHARERAEKARTEQAEKQQQNPPMPKEDVRYPVGFLSAFTEEEKADIDEVIRRFKERGIDVGRLGIKIRKINRTNTGSSQVTCYSACSDDQLPEELRGYPLRGNANMDGTIDIAPRKHLNARWAWQQQHGMVPKGEEGRNNDFRWYLSHEVGHIILFRRYMNAMASKYWEPQEGDPYFLRNWYGLNRSVEDNTEFSLEGAKKGYNRPPGFPTLYSALGAPRETFCDTLAYWILDADYAKDDKYISYRIDLLRDEFSR